MSNELERRIRNLRSVERSIRPDAAWVGRTRATLLMQVKNTLPTGQMPFTHRLKEFFQLVVLNKLTQAMRKPVMAAVSTVVLATGGSILSVSAAEQALPGDFFYGLKLVTEQARLALTATGEDKLILKTEFTERRVTEFQQIAGDPENQERVGEVMETLKRDMSTLKQQLTDVAHDTPEKAVSSAKFVDKKTNKVITDLQAAKSQLSPESKEKVTEVQSAAADAGVKAIEVLAEKHQESSDNVTASDIAQAIQDHTKTVAGVTIAPLAFNAASSSATTTPLLTSAGLATSTHITSSTLSEIVSQVKDLTTQSFALQKAQDQLDVVASGLASGDASSTVSGTDSSATGTVATTSTAPLDSGTSTAPSATPTASGTSP